MEPKVELQQVRRIFLGELFAFVFFFAGAMSILVGPMHVPIKTAAITVGISIVLSAVCFLWLAFTTPAQRAQPRYAFMALSLLPAFSICAIVLGFYQIGLTEPSNSGHLVILNVLSIDNAGPNRNQLGKSKPADIAALIFADENAALDEVLTSMGFKVNANFDEERKLWTRTGSVSTPMVTVRRLFEYNLYGSVAQGHYFFLAEISNSTTQNSQVMLTESGLVQIRDELKERWKENLAARIAAKKALK